MKDKLDDLINEQNRLTNEILDLYISRISQIENYFLNKNDYLEEKAHNFFMPMIEASVRLTEIFSKKHKVDNGAIATSFIFGYRKVAFYVALDNRGTLH